MVDLKWPATLRDSVSTSSHSLSWSAVATDPGWAAHPAAPTTLHLDVIDVTITLDADRVPTGRLSITIAPPFDSTGRPLWRWLSPLRRTCTVNLSCTYNGVVRQVGTYQLRRRRLSWPMPGGIVLDVATWDGAAAEDQVDGDLANIGIGGQ